MAQYIREILPGMFQFLIQDESRTRVAYYVKRKFGNYLFYGAPPVAELFRLIRAQGGLVKYFPAEQVAGESYEAQYFRRFGASAVYTTAPTRNTAYRWELFQDQQLLYRDLDLLTCPEVPEMAIYRLRHRRRTILLPGSWLSLQNGHWLFPKWLASRQRRAIRDLLAQSDFDYLFPRFSQGFISFQQVEGRFKDIQLRHLGLAAE
jgi:hypothetical protein